jgi:hypothetical protein
MPGTARSLGVQIGNFRSEAFGAAKYLSQYHSRGRRGMLAAYNAGPAGNPNNPETRAYIPKVLALRADLQGRRRWRRRGATGRRVAVGGQSLLQLAGSSVGNVSQGSEGILPLLQALSAQKPPVPSAGSLPAGGLCGACDAAGGADAAVGRRSGSEAGRERAAGSVRTQGGDVAHANVPGVSALIGGGGSSGGGGGGAVLGRVAAGDRDVRGQAGGGVDRAGVRRARATGLWKGTVTSGVRTRQQQLAAAKRFGLRHYAAEGPAGLESRGGSFRGDRRLRSGGAGAIRAAPYPVRLHRGLADDPVHFSWTVATKRRLPV